MGWPAITSHGSCLYGLLCVQGSKKQPEACSLAVGNAAGDVKLYDTQLGELLWRSSNSMEG